MVRFSCFNAHSHSHKPKRTSQMPFESMQKTLEDYPQDQLSKGFINPACIESQHMKDHSCDLLNNRSMLVAGSSSVERGWKSEEINRKFTVESNLTGHLKKSRSLGSVLEQEGRVSGSNDTEDEIDHGYSCDDAPCQNGLVVSAVSKDPETSILNQGQEAFPSESPQVSSDMVNNESIFSVGDPQNIEKEGHEYSDTQLSGECTGNSGETTPRALPVIVKACSMPNIASGTQIPPTILGPRSRSSEDLQVLERKEKDNLIHQVVCKVIQDQVKDDVKVEKNNLETIVEDGFESYNYAGTAKDWIIPVADEEHQVNYLKGESSGHQSAGSPGREYKIKRIEEWVINLQHCSSLDENNEPSHETDQVNRVSDIDGLAASKLESKATPGMEAAKKYISSLPVTANTAQLSNLGLVVIPFLSAFVSLKVLNLSGNAIVRITAGALPRGLHMLNLAKNNISTIEGLRELNRLRVLDLSYNRIVRIGHGLASCSSLKELYLAGNKISEVEGLHRLLKLNVLDLRFNKISTAKCLGQLAANYISMQAISLEGNPAQKNVGDEQLRKQLQGLLPQLAYYNRQPIKAGSLKDTADRSTRLGTSHQFDRGLRSDHRLSRKGAYGVAAHKASSSSTHGRKSQAIISPKRTRGSRHGHLPPTGTRGTAQHQYQHFDFSSKTLSVRPDLSMRRSRSEGTLGAL